MTLRQLPLHLLIALALLSTPMAAQPAEAPLDLQTLIREALTNNPDLQSLENAALAAEARVPQAGALPDPVLSFNLMNLPVNSFDFDQEPMTGKQIALMQKFPFPGKQGLREEIARDQATVMDFRYRELRNQLVRNVKIAYYRLYLIDKSIAITRKNAEVLEEFTKIAESKYSVGRGLQQDVLRAQVELSKITDRLIDLQQRRDAQEAALNALLDRSPDAPLGAVPDLDFSALAVTLPQLRDSADANRPLLLAWETSVRQNEKQVGLARKGYLPDFSLGIAYSQRDVLKSGIGGVDFLSGMVNVEVPLYFWRKQRKQVEESRYGLGATQRRLREVRNGVYAELETLRSDIERNKRRLDLYRTGILPQARQSLESAIAGYQTDKVDFLTLLNNQINLFNFELDYFRILSDYHINLARLEAAVGASLTP